MNNNLEFENEDPSPDSIEDNHPRTNYGEGYGGKETLEDITLEEVFGSAYCQFSVVENKLAILYRNQEQLLKAIKLLSKKTNESKRT